MQEYKIFTKDFHEYSVAVSETERGLKYTLRYSQNPRWTEPGKEIISVVDDIKTADFVFSKQLSNRLNCAELIELKIVLNVIAQDQTNLADQYYAIECSKTTVV